MNWRNYVIIIYLLFLWFYLSNWWNNSIWNWRHLISSRLSRFSLCGSRRYSGSWLRCLDWLGNFLLRCGLYWCWSYRLLWSWVWNCCLRCLLWYRLNLLRLWLNHLICWQSTRCACLWNNILWNDVLWYHLLDWLWLCCHRNSSSCSRRRLRCHWCSSRSWNSSLWLCDRCLSYYRWLNLLCLWW